jgi:CBS domain-containing protein
MSAAFRIISDLMRQPVVAVGPGATVDEVQALAESHAIHHVPIVQHGKLLGLVCTCDLTRARGDLRVLQLARRNVVTASPSCTPAEAALLMKEHAVGSVLIVNRDGLWGIVTRGDLANADPELARLLASVECALCHSTHHLRQAGDGETLLCVACAERASASHWFAPAVTS